MTDFPAADATPIAGSLLNAMWSASGMRRTLLALSATASLIGGVQPAAAQYTGTYFVPGLNESSDIWTTTGTPDRLAGRVFLGERRLPSLVSHKDIHTQTGQLAGIVRGEPSGWNFYFVGHSMGGVISRNMLISADPAINTAPRIAGIVTVASPNRGAPVAEKASVYDPRTTLGLIEGFLHTIKYLIVNPLLGAIDALASWLVRHKLDEGLFDKLNATAKLLQIEGAKDLRPSSPSMQRIGGTADGAPHAAVWGVVPQRYSWARIAASREYESPEAQVRTLKQVRALFLVCRSFFYNAIIKTGTGKMCARGDRAIGGFDEKWKEWTHFSHAPSSPIDGLLPEETLRYPFEGNPGKQLRANGNEDHYSIQWRDPGVIRIGDAMLAAGMRQADSPPPPPDDPPPFGGGCANPQQLVCDP